MTKLLIKTTVFTLLLSAVTLVSKAQIGYDYAQYDIGFGGSLNQVYGDAEIVKTKPAAHVSTLLTTKPRLLIMWLKYKPAPLKVAMQKNYIGQVL
jgi:hypothetical protein